MEWTGVPIDTDRVHAVLDEMVRRGARTSEELADWAGHHYDGPLVVKSKTVGHTTVPNWNSPNQLVLFLHSPLGLGLEPSPYRKKGTVDVAVDWENDDGEISTDDRALEWLAAHHPDHRDGLNLIRRWRAETRMANYCRDWLSVGVRHPDGTFRLHPLYGVANDQDNRPGAVTGRFAVKNPPLQQVPARGEYGALLRNCFVAPPGWRLVVADYSQLEVVVLAHITYRLFGATGLRDRLDPGPPDNPTPDIHTTTAKFVFGDVLRYPGAVQATLQDFTGPLKWLRNNIKWVRYGLNYGKGAVGFGSTLFTPDGAAIGRDEAQKLIDALLKFDPEIGEYQTWVRDWITRNRSIGSLMGRVLWLPEARGGTRGLRNRAWRRALNYPMQSGGQELTARAMIAVHDDPLLTSMGARLILQVHDELLLLVPEEHADAAAVRLQDLMMYTTRLDAPLLVKAHHAGSWSEAK